MWKIYEGSIQKRKGRTREIGDQDIIGECQVTGKTESKTQLANGLKCKRRESGRRFRRSRKGFFGPFKCFPSFQTKKTRIVHNCVIDGTMDISVCYLFLDFGKKQAKKQREIKCPSVESGGYCEAVRIRWEYKLKFPGPISTISMNNTQATLCVYNRRLMSYCIQDSQAELYRRICCASISTSQSSKLLDATVYNMQTLPSPSRRIDESLYSSSKSISVWALTSTCVLFYFLSDRIDKV